MDLGPASDLFSSLTETREAMIQELKKDCQTYKQCWVQLQKLSHSVHLALRVCVLCNVNLFPACSLCHVSVCILVLFSQGHDLQK